MHHKAIQYNTMTCDMFQDMWSCIGFDADA